MYILLIWYYLWSQTYPNVMNNNCWVATTLNPLQIIIIISQEFVIDWVQLDSWKRSLIQLQSNCSWDYNMKTQLDLDHLFIWLVVGVGYWLVAQVGLLTGEPTYLFSMWPSFLKHASSVLKENSKCECSESPRWKHKCSYEQTPFLPYINVENRVIKISRFQTTQGMKTIFHWGFSSGHRLSQSLDTSYITTLVKREDLKRDF